MRTFHPLKCALIFFLLTATAQAERRSLKIEDDLKIQFPKNKSEAKKYLFQPYPKVFIQEVIRFLHVVIRETRPTLMDVDWPEPTLKKRLLSVLRLTQFLQLLKLHPLFQIRAGATKPLAEILDRYESDLLRRIQLNPDRELAKLRDRLMQRPFEDTYSLHGLFSRIQTFIQPVQLESEDDWNWFGERAAEWLEPDLHHTYQVWLDENPMFILQELKTEFRDRIVANVEISLPYVSQTYLNHNRYLIQDLSLISPDHPELKRLKLALEFSSLRFEPFDQAPEVYEELASIYPSFEGSKDYFAQDPKRAKLFFPFFDQIKNEADRLLQRGQFACVEAMPMDPDVCVPFWSNAVELYQFVIEYAPFRILSRKSAEALKEIREKNRSGRELISEPKLMRLIDQTEKPYL